MTNATENVASVKVNVLDQNGKTFTGDATANNLTFTLTSGTGVVTNNATFTAQSGNTITFQGAKAGTAVYKVTSGKSGLNYIMVSITVYGSDDVVVKYGLTGMKDLNVEAAYDTELAKTESYKTTINLASGADNFDAASTYKAVGAYSIVATKNGATIATATINVEDTGVKPVVTIKKNSIDYSEVSGENDFASNSSTETGWTIAGVKYVSGNTDVLGTVSADNVKTLDKKGTGTATLYNVVVIVTKGGRQFEVATNQSVTVTNVQQFQIY